MPPPSPPSLIPPIHWKDVKNDLIGFALVIFASTGICISLNLQRLVHTRNADSQTGQPIKNFTELPLWWAAIVLNTSSELLNLAALGYAPATLVTPLGCLTVVFNALSSVLWLGEPFFGRDVFGIILIWCGVVCVVWAQIGAPAPPITPKFLEHAVLTPGFWVFIGIIVVGLLLLVAFVHKKYSRR